MHADQSDQLNPLSNHTAAITQTYVSTGFRDAGEAGEAVGGELGTRQDNASIGSTLTGPHHRHPAT